MHKIIACVYYFDVKRLKHMQFVQNLAATLSVHIHYLMLFCWNCAECLHIPSDVFMAPRHPGMGAQSLKGPQWAAERIFYPRDAMLARVIAIATCPSVCLSVCLSVCHAPVLCQNEES